jgi:hypothetical protein
MKKYSEQEMATLIRDIETQFSAFLTKAEESSLNKSETVQPVQEVKVETVVPVVEPKVEVPVETVAKAEVQPAIEHVEKHEDCEYSEEDIKEMDGLYKSMAKKEMEIHFNSVKKALYGDQEPVQKSEEVKVIIPDNSSDLLKAEVETFKKENETVKKENDELKKNMDKLTSAFTNFVKGAPKRKAITNLEYVKKSEVETVNVQDVSKLTKSEINAKLVEKIRSGKVEEKDRKLINDFCINNKPIESVKHLL